MQSTPPVAGALLGGPAAARPLLLMSGVMAVPGFVGLVPPASPATRGDRSADPISTVSQP